MARRPRTKARTRSEATSGGGWIASGPAETSRQPTPYLPEGLKFKADEGPGEVQTPLVGAVAGME